jgi:hypothetical protein
VLELHDAVVQGLQNVAEAVTSVKPNPRPVIVTVCVPVATMLTGKSSACESAGASKLIVAAMVPHPFVAETTTLLLVIADSERKQITAVLAVQAEVTHRLPMKPAVGV